MELGRGRYHTGLVSLLWGRSLEYPVVNIYKASSIPKRERTCIDDDLSVPWNGFRVDRAGHHGSCAKFVDFMYNDAK